MKTDLEILIEHVQSEFDHLKSSMDECIGEWDFDGAKAFRKSLVYTKRKLNVLRCLQNPNYEKLNQLAGMISRMEKSLNEGIFEMKDLDEQIRQRIEEHFNEATKKRIEESKQEFEKLKTIVPAHRNDDDKILELLEALERNEIHELEFEIKKDEIFLMLRVHNGGAELKFRSSETANIGDYLSKSAKSILGKLGFNTESYARQIFDFSNVDKTSFLEELAIIYFEVFEIYGEDLNLKIIYNSTANN